MPYIHITHENSILHLRFARQEKKNAITGAMYDAMTKALTSANFDENIRIILFSAAGNTFTAGNDISDFLQFAGSIETSPAALFIKALADCQKPMIAAVNGKAVGIGTTMLLHCDLVYAAPDASFSTPFVNLGLVPEAGASMLLPMRIGYARAAQMLLLSEPMSAVDALNTGLINEIIPLDTLLEHATQKAAILASKPTSALSASRALMRSGQEALNNHMNEEFKQFGLALNSPEAKKAFLMFMRQ